MSISVCFCLFLLVSIRLFPFLSFFPSFSLFLWVSYRTLCFFCRFLTDSVQFYPFLYVSDSFCPFCLSFCPFLFVSFHLCPFLFVSFVSFWLFMSLWGVLVLVLISPNIQCLPYAGFSNAFVCLCLFMLVLSVSDCLCHFGEFGYWC